MGLCVQIGRHMFTRAMARATWSKSEQAIDSDRRLSVEFADFVTVRVATGFIHSATFLVRQDLSEGCSGVDCVGIYP